MQSKAKAKRFPVLTVGQLKMIVAIAALCEWGILSAIIGFYQSIDFLSSFSADILRGSLFALSSVAGTSFVFAIKLKKEKRIITITEDELREDQDNAMNEILAELKVRFPVLDYNGFAERILVDFVRACRDRFLDRVSYDPTVVVSPLQVILVTLVLVVLFLSGLGLVLVRAYGLIPGLLSDEKLFGATNSTLVFAIYAFVVIRSSLLSFKD